ncbi:MAG TPA: hypothetical protein DDY68_00275 [Porphyromonadaceae bacterium]|nr:hypothetical protein [Porphyromonadaceae bacterium]
MLLKYFHLLTTYQIESPRIFCRDRVCYVQKNRSYSISKYNMISIPIEYDLKKRRIYSPFFSLPLCRMNLFKR